MKYNVVALTLLFVGFGLPAKSEMASDGIKYVSVQDFFNDLQDPKMKMYILGVGDGFSWGNILAGREGAPDSYCQPPNLSLNVGEIIQIMTLFSNTKHVAPATPVAVVLSESLQSTFPCPRPKAHLRRIRQARRHDRRRMMLTQERQATPRRSMTD